MPQSIRVPSSSPSCLAFLRAMHTHTLSQQNGLSHGRHVATAFIDFPEVPLILPKASAEAVLVSVSPR